MPRDHAKTDATSWDTTKNKPEPKNEPCPLNLKLPRDFPNMKTTKSNAVPTA